MHNHHEYTPCIQPLVDRCISISEKFGSTPLVSSDDVTETSYSEVLKLPDNGIAKARGLRNFRVGYSEKRKKHIRIMIQARRDSHLHKILEQIPYFGQSHDKQITKASYVFWSWVGEDNADTAISVLEELANLIEI